MDILSTINRQLPFITIGGSVIFLGWILQHHLLQDSSGLHTSHDPENATTLEAPAAKMPSKLSAGELNEITNRHLFGKVAKPKVEESKPVEEPKALEPDFSNLPETRIPLKLSGIAFSEDKQRAFAMIITADGKQADYQAGEPIGKEAKVHLIEEKRVIIERNGNFEALSLPEVSSSPRGQARSARNNRSQATRPRPKRTPDRRTPNSQ